MKVAQSNQSETTNGSTAGESGKPVRRNFYRQVVVASNAQIVPEEEWRKVVTATGKEGRKQMKAAGLQSVRIFDADGYNAAKKAFHEDNKLRAKTDRETIISDAFREAGVDFDQRISRSLRTLLPLFNEVPTKRTVQTFRGIVRSVVSTIPANAAKEADKVEKQESASTSAAREQEEAVAH